MLSLAVRSGTWVLVAAVVVGCGGNGKGGGGAGGAIAVGGASGGVFGTGGSPGTGGAMGSGGSPAGGVTGKGGAATGGSSAGTSGGTCTGTASACGVHSTHSECATVGCKWKDDTCEGTPLDCPNPGTNATCTAIVGCSWSATSSSCSGSAFACNLMLDSVECATQGCTWVPAACSGTAPSCGGFPTEYSCAFAGCTWRPGIPSNGGAGGAGGTSTGGASGKDAGADAPLDGPADLSGGSDTADLNQNDRSRQPPATDGPAPAIESFSGAMVPRGTLTALCWHVVGARTLTIDPDVGNVMGLGSDCVDVVARETITYTLTLNGTITAQATIYALDGLFQAVGDLLRDLEKHTASLLPDGKVLIVGGYSYNGTFGNAELFDPATKKFTSAASVTHARASHTATTLADGRILLAGGVDSGNSLTASVEIYDPAAARFAAVGDMTSGRSGHAAALLPDGRVLITGGGVPAPPSSGLTREGQSDTGEIFDPKTGAFTATSGNMSIKRERHTATTLADGTVLIAGGSRDSPEIPSADVFDPTAGTFRAIGPMVAPRRGHTATLLANGAVLLTGGDGGGYGKTAEFYDPKTQTFKATGSLVRSRQFHNATLLPSGKVLITGDSNYSLGTAELYEPDAGSFSVTSYMVSGAYNRTATLLLDGSLLVTGGNAIVDTSRRAIAKAELYVP